jgi:hypothetical protein
MERPTATANEAFAAQAQTELRRRAVEEAVAALSASGWAVVPGAALGIPAAAVEDAHVAIWNAADRLAYQRSGVFPERPLRSVVGNFDDPEWSTLAPAVFKGVGGFTKHQFLPEQVALQTAPAIEAFYRDLFAAGGELLPGPGEHTWRRPDGAGPVLVEPDPRDPHAAAAEAPVLFYTYAERANITLPGALQAIVGQAGALPHLDCNPWARPGPDLTDPVLEEKAHYLTRRWPIDRPFQSYVSLTDCPGGSLSGGMGVSDGSHLRFDALKALPPHGKNPRWGNLVRILPSPGGAWRSEAGADDARAVDEMHEDMLAAMLFPAYRAGDLVVWNRETVHAGCKRNFSARHQARVYVNKLPLNAQNDLYVRHQGEKAILGTQCHGRRADKGERFRPNELTPYQRAVLGLGVD